MTLSGPGIRQVPLRVASTPVVAQNVLPSRREQRSLTLRTHTKRSGDTVDNPGGARFRGKVGRGGDTNKGITSTTGLVTVGDDRPGRVTAMTGCRPWRPTTGAVCRGA